MKKWRCQVCRYVHEGDEPPDVCPVCKAAKDKFVELGAEGDQEEEKGSRYDKESFLVRQIIKHHLHPIFVHIPNGVIPVAMLFVLAGAVLNSENFDLAAFYNLFIVMMAMPAVLFTGYIDWKKKYGGKITTLFIIKIVSGITVFALSFILVFWRIINPDITVDASSGRMLYLGLYLLMLGAAAAAGHMGGKLVFKD